MTKSKTKELVKNYDSICQGKIETIHRLIKCPYCKKKTRSGMQIYYDDIFCLKCKRIKATI